MSKRWNSASSVLPVTQLSRRGMSAPVDTLELERFLLFSGAITFVLIQQLVSFVSTDVLVVRWIGVKWISNKNRRHNKYGKKFLSV